MSLSKFRKKTRKIEIPDSDCYLNLRGLSLKNIIEIANIYEDLIVYIFDGINLEDNNDIVSKLIERAPDLCYLIISTCDEDEEADISNVRDLPILTQLQALNAILELTLPEKIEDLDNEIKKIVAELSKLAKSFSKEKNKKK